MKTFFLITTILISSVFVFGQNDSQKKSSLKTQSEIKETGQFSSDIEESLYYAPIRFVIVYNETIISGTFNERQIDILFDEKSFTKANISAVFNQIAKKYPNPEGLMIKLHTTLETIETPEEKQMTRISHNNRFRNHQNRFKNALYLRNNVTGFESYIYTNSLFPYGYENVIISEKP